MLRMGLLLFSSSTMGVIYRVADFTYSMNPILKWYCLTGLSVSLICFIATYLHAEASRQRKSFAHQDTSYWQTVRLPATH